MVLHRPIECTALTVQMKFYFTSPARRLHVQVTAAKLGEDNFRIADNPGSEEFLSMN
jgi:hypothetical protein